MVDKVNKAAIMFRVCYEHVNNFRRKTLTQDSMSVSAHLATRPPAGWEKLIGGLGESPPVEVQAVDFNLRITPEGIAMLRAVLLQLHVEGLAWTDDTDSEDPSPPQ